MSRSGEAVEKMSDLLFKEDDLSLRINWNVKCVTKDGEYQIKWNEACLRFTSPSHQERRSRFSIIFCISPLFMSVSHAMSLRLAESLFYILLYLPVNKCLIFDYWINIPVAVWNEEGLCIWQRWKRGEIILELHNYRKTSSVLVVLLCWWDLLSIFNPINCLFIPK